MMPGVTVTSGQGRPGQDGSTIRIRGVGTLNSASPYILIDGIESGSMNDIDPNDIESISVLKDASSAAIYGSKASNGVILITTKRGKTGAPRISYNGYVGASKATSMIDRVSSAVCGIVSSRDVIVTRTSGCLRMALILTDILIRTGMMRLIGQVCCINTMLVLQEVRRT